MATDKASIRDYVIIGLLLINVGISSFSMLRQPVVPSGKQSGSTSIDISEQEALGISSIAIDLFNSRDNAGFYEKFDSLAKAQLTQQQFAEQLNKLYPLMGSISDPAFVSATLAGSDNGRDYYNLNYKVRLTGGPFSSGDMKLTVVRRDGALNMVGFFMNGTAQPGR